jgi:cAMP-dependent protein kinase regulator
MPSEKAVISDSIQKYLGKADWKSAIAEMEKLFGIDPDPITRVRIGDAYQKLGRKSDAVKEYVRAADLYASQGAVVRSLAQYKLALRLDPGNKTAVEKMAALYSNNTVAAKKAEPVTAGAQKPASSVIPLFSSFTQEEFTDFTGRMMVHVASPGEVIIRQGDKGKSVYVIATGSVKVFTTLLSGEQVDLAVLWPSDFFGEMSFLTGRPRSATVEATEDTNILEIDEEKLRDLITRRPHVGEVLRTYYETRTKGTVDKIQETNV